MLFVTTVAQEKKSNKEEKYAYANITYAKNK
jgi:hypothetical protein